MHTADKRRHMLQHEWRQLGAQKLLPDHISGSAATFRHAFQTQNSACNHCEMSGSYPGRSSEPCMVSVWALGSTWAICRSNPRAIPGLTMQWCHAAAPPATQQPPQTAARRRALRRSPRQGDGDAQLLMDLSASPPSLAGGLLFSKLA